ncbi:MAG: transcription antitermination factor NusB [Pseudomonadota bacterium]
MSGPETKPPKPGLAARKTATTVLTRIMDDGRGLDGLVDAQHGLPPFLALSPEDRSLVRAICMAACRHYGEILAALERMVDRPLPKNARHLHHTLTVAATQILFLDIPDSAAVDVAVTQIRSDQRSKRFASLANAVLRRLVREKDELLGAPQIKSRAAGAQQPVDRAVANMPPWLRSRTRKAYGRQRLSAIAAQHMVPPALDICVKSDPHAWADRLGGTVLMDKAVRVVAQGQITALPGFDAGEWWVQDVAAQIPARLMGEIAGKHVADFCAAPGGKTAQLITAGAHVTALEQSTPRLERLRQNLARLKLQATLVEGDLFNHRPQKPYDAILLDAPCSSLGTIRRHPDVQWTKSPTLVSELAALQARMVAHAATCLAPGGQLVFANCSLDREEGEDMVARLDLETLGLRLDPVTAHEVDTQWITGQGTVRTLPHYLACQQQADREVTDDTVQSTVSGMDGFFCARFIKI